MRILGTKFSTSTAAKRPCGNTKCFLAGNREPINAKEHPQDEPAIALPASIERDRNEKINEPSEIWKKRNKKYKNKIYVLNIIEQPQGKLTLRLQRNGVDMIKEQLVYVKVNCKYMIRTNYHAMLNLKKIISIPC